MSRNYRALGAKQRPWDSAQLKPWVDMFQTTDRSVVEAKCAREGFTPVWGDDGSLRLFNAQPAVKAHPKTREPIWFNHATSSRSTTTPPATDGSRSTALG